MTYIEDEAECSVDFLSLFLSDDSEVLLVPFYFDGIEKTEYNTWSHLYSHKFRLSFSLVEKMIFAHFAVDSSEKKLFRILKIVRDKFMIDDDRFEYLELIRNARQNEP